MPFQERAFVLADRRAERKQFVATGRPGRHRLAVTVGMRR